MGGNVLISALTASSLVCRCLMVSCSFSTSGLSFKFFQASMLSYRSFEALLTRSKIFIVEAWTNLQDNPEVEKMQETIKQRQTELDAVKAEIKTLPPMQNMLKVKQSNELHQEIEVCKRKETLLVNSVQPLINEALELSTATDSQLKVLKEYDAFAQEKANEASATTLQEIVEKEQEAEDIMRNLNK